LILGGGRSVVVNLGYPTHIGALLERI
jgi:hypothetical protein